MQNSHNPKLSVVLPVHNGEQYLHEAIESVLSQSFKDYELIVIDDASTDNTQGILENYLNKDPRVILIKLEKQASLADVLNEGLKVAKGSYIVRMDADDVMYPTRLQEQYHFMRENPAVVVCGGQIDLIDENGESFGERRYPTDTYSLKKNLFIFSPFAHSAVIIRKSVLDEVGGYERGLKKVEDIMLWFVLASKGDFSNLSTKVLKYRVRRDSESLGNVYDHFIRTYGIRKRVIKEGIHKIDLRQKMILTLQYFIVSIMRWLPRKWFMKVFEIGRKILS